MGLETSVICVFAGSSPGARGAYAKAARALGEELVSRGLDLVYGGSKVGLMGVVADAVLEGGGRVTGVIPKALVAKEVAHEGLTELRVVASMHERKALMAELAGGFIALPGGMGTLEELLEILTWSQLGFHGKPSGLLNAEGYYDGLVEFFDHLVRERFVKEAHRAMALVEADPGLLLDAMSAYVPPRVAKWLDASST